MREKKKKRNSFDDEFNRISDCWRSNRPPNAFQSRARKCWFVHSANRKLNMIKALWNSTPKNHYYIEWIIQWKHIAQSTWTLFIDLIHFFFFYISFCLFQKKYCFFIHFYDNFYFHFYSVSFFVIFHQALCNWIILRLLMESQIIRQ